MGSSWLSLLITSTIYLSIFALATLHKPTFNIDEISEYGDSTVVTLVKTESDGKSLVDKKSKPPSINSILKLKSKSQPQQNQKVKKVVERIDNIGCCSAFKRLEDKDKDKSVKKKSALEPIKEKRIKEVKRETEKKKEEKLPEKEVKREKDKSKQSSSESIATKESMRSVAKRGGRKKINLFFKELKRGIAQNKLYPARARRRGVEGRVKISFTIEQNGSISNIRLKGKRVFFRSAKMAILKSQPIDTKDVPLNLPINVSLTLSYRLK
jgi:TonB family protein